jgi:hypothetical protein
MRYLALNDYLLFLYMPCHSSSRPRWLILNRGSGSTQYIQPFKVTQRDTAPLLSSLISSSFLDPWQRNTHPNLLPKEESPTIGWALIQAIPAIQISIKEGSPSLQFTPNGLLLPSYFLHLFSICLKNSLSILLLHFLFSLSLWFSIGQHKKQ